MEAICPVCQVLNVVPDEARAFRCHNCAKLIEGSSGKWVPEGQGVKTVVLVLGGILLVFLLMWLTGGDWT